MNLRQHHLAILVISLAVATGFAALDPAYAESPPSWMLPPDEVTAALPVELAGKAGTVLTLLATIAGVPTKISCEKVTLDKALLEAEGKGSGALTLSSCQTLLKGVKSEACTPYTGAEKGVIKSNALKAQLVSHESSALVRLQPQSGTVLGTIFVGEECSIGEEIPVAGSFYAKESNGKFETLEASHTFVEGPLTALTALGNSATIDGSSIISLAGAHAGLAWSGLGSKPSWMLPPDEVTAALPVELAGKAGTVLTLLATIAGVPTKISCEKVTLDKALLEAEGKGSGALTLSSCQTLLKGVKSEACTPYTGAEKGVIKSNALKAQLVSHESSALVRLQPQSGTVLGTIFVGEECSIGEEIPVAGSFYAKESNGKFETLEASHTFVEGPLTALTALGNSATIDGSSIISLAGAHAGLAWSGLGS